VLFFSVLLCGCAIDWVSESLVSEVEDDEGEEEEELEDGVETR